MASQRFKNPTPVLCDPGPQTKLQAPQGEVYPMKIPASFVIKNPGLMVQKNCFSLSVSKKPRSNKDFQIATMLDPPPRKRKISKTSISGGSPLLISEVNSQFIASENSKFNPSHLAHQAHRKASKNNPRAMPKIRTNIEKLTVNQNPKE